ncbi:type II toxin-antitoxin system RelB/DinJ family antitoxin [Eubacterium barkeri]|uniref:DNA-damage-inducible protein J n=1 Tax=Eubacterium barkeri TaxID=1528 RepID=A0A1H3HJ25_EUBBA|nr:type II toxin-antitoxin system RelB/DinJ family antitoxin [Eubacterium barkeri]SDY15487.1 DNA-damage-inducible protein J [Eubacterium barkeri]
MANTTINIRLDQEVKKNFDAICNDMGMNMSTAVNIFAKAVIQKRGIPFQVTAGDPFYSASNMHALEMSSQQIKEGKIVTKTMDELEAMADE